MLPVIPVVLASLVAMVFMRFTNIGKSKDRFRLIGGLVAIAIAIGFQAIVQRGQVRLRTQSSFRK